MTLIEIDLEGGLVQEVCTSERHARVLVHDADAAEVGEDPRTNLVAVYDPLLVWGAEDPDAFIEAAKEAASETFADQPRGEPNDDPDIPFCWQERRARPSPTTRFSSVQPGSPARGSRPGNSKKKLNSNTSIASTDAAH